MLRRLLQTYFAFLTLSSFALAQYQEFYYNERMEGQNPYGADPDNPIGLEDPSFEFPFSARPRQDKVFVSKDFETNDFSAVQSLTRSWIGTEEEERVLGRKFLRIRGTGCLANWFPIQPLFSKQPSLGHYVTVRAQQDGPFEAIFGINYFDANWKLIQKDSALISGSEPGVSRGDGDLLKKYTIPTHVPYNAAFGQVWIAAPFADGTTTFDFLNVFTEKRFTSNEWFIPNANLLRNGFPILTDLVNDFDFYKTGYEFWNAIPGSEAGVELNTWTPEFATSSYPEEQPAFLLGRPGRITNIYQVFNVEANQPYTLRLFTAARPGMLNPSIPFARGWFGIDFFDSNAKKIDQVVYDLSQGESIEEVTYMPAANADFAIAWFYIEPLFRNEAIPIFSVNIYVPSVEATAKSLAAASTKTTATTQKGAPKKPSKSVVPNSPITPAIALKAKNSLPTLPAKPTTSAKPTTKRTPKKPGIK